MEGTCPYCNYFDARGDQCDLCGRLLDSLELKNPRCKVDGATPVRRDTRHIFFAMDKLQSEIEIFFRESAHEGGWSNNGKTVTSSWLKEGLKERSITRDYKWGVPVPLPGFEEKVIYSWFDACIGYVSITAGYTDQWEKWWHDPDVQLYQFIGKDNVVFHSVNFPGSQIGTRDTWTKLHHLATTEYLTYEGGKFSKSRGVGVFGDSAQETGVPGDVWRFHLLSHRPESGVTEFTWDSFIADNNNVLLKNLGNFVNRIVKSVNSRHYNSVVPDWTAYQEPSFESWKRDINGYLKQYLEDLDTVKLRAGIHTVLEISQKGNAFLQFHKLVNNSAKSAPAECAAVVGLAVNLAHLLAALLTPYMPATAESINTQLKATALRIPDVWTADSIRPGHEIGAATYLFTRIKPEKAQEWRDRFGSDQDKWKLWKPCRLRFAV